jgi:asparagine synthetase B (glutamine-hydrolysing)
VSDEDRRELYLALLVMAAIDPWGHHLRRELVMLMTVEIERRLIRTLPEIAEMISEAEKTAEQRGEQRAIMELLGRLFARRIGRRPTTEEESSIVERARAVGPGEVEDALLDLDADALVRWLAGPASRP